MWSHIQEKIKANIINDKINDPTMTTRELQKKYEKDGVKSNSTIWVLIKKEITQNEQNFKELIQQNNDIIKQANQLILDKFLNQKESLRISEISTVKDVSFRQNQLLTGWATDNINLNIADLSSKTAEELQEMLEELN